jgi:hypothetical protein
MVFASVARGGRSEREQENESEQQWRGQKKLASTREWGRRQSMAATRLLGAACGRPRRRFLKSAEAGSELAMVADRPTLLGQYS